MHSAVAVSALLVMALYVVSASSTDSSTLAHMQYIDQLPISLTLSDIKASNDMIRLGR